MERASRGSNDISKPAFLALTWIGFFTAAVLTVARFWIRHTRLGGFFWDDAFHLLALLVLFVSAVVYTVFIDVLYMLSALAGGSVMPSLDFFPRQMPKYLGYQFAQIILFWICLWSVKMAFLGFYRRFLAELTYLTVAWWFTTVFTAMALVGCLATHLTICEKPSDYFVLGRCSNATSVRNTLRSIRYSTAVDVISDALIMALPVWIVISIGISIRQKAALIALFSLAMIIISFAIARAVASTSSITAIGVGSFDKASPIPIALYSMLEATVAVIISCLPTFRILMTSRRNRSQYVVQATMANVSAKSTERLSVGPSSAVLPSAGNDEAGPTKSRWRMWPFRRQRGSGGNSSVRLGRITHSTQQTASDASTTLVDDVEQSPSGRRDAKGQLTPEPGSKATKARTWSTDADVNKPLPPSPGSPSALDQRATPMMLA